MPARDVAASGRALFLFMLLLEAAEQSAVKLIAPAKSFPAARKARNLLVFLPCVSGNQLCPCCSKNSQSASLHGVHKFAFICFSSFLVLQYGCVILLRSAAVSAALGAFPFKVSFVRRDQVRAHAVSSCFFGFDVPIRIKLSYTRRLFYLSAHLSAQHCTSLLSHSFGSSCVIQSLSLLRFPQNPRCFLFCAALFTRRFLLRSLRSLRVSLRQYSPNMPVRAAAPAAMPLKNVIIKYLRHSNAFTNTQSPA